VWLRIWKTTNFGKLSVWDDLCDLVFGLLQSLLPDDARGKRMLEAGSGTGRVSLRLAKSGANVLLIDISRVAMKFSKDVFKRLDAEGDFVVGDVLHLPFQDSKLDNVWSSGVFEHFDPEEQKKEFNEALRVLRPHGKKIIIVPNSNAVVYNLFRKLDMRLGRWKYGYEDPISADSLCNLPRPSAQFSRGFVYQLSFVSIPLLGRIVKIGAKFLLSCFPSISELDRRIQGYLVGFRWEK
jgi:ubiquinone/menaquinone biosynthesis C-methylase UbiE